jgi:Fe2+ or Zn2+ uptake regulation protein
MRRDRWVAQVEDVLRRAGHRRSSARPAVVRALAEADRPLTVQELEQHIRRSKRVSGPTIYHALELLGRHGLAHRIEIGDGQARYLPADTAAHFLLCRLCGALITLTIPALEDTITQAAERLGVAIESRPLVLHGICAECQPSAGPWPLARHRDGRLPITAEATGSV